MREVSKRTCVSPSHPTSPDRRRWCPSLMRVGPSFWMYSVFVVFFGVDKHYLSLCARGGRERQKGWGGRGGGIVRRAIATFGEVFRSEVLDKEVCVCPARRGRSARGIHGVSIRCGRNKHLLPSGRREGRRAAAQAEP